MPVGVIPGITPSTHPSPLACSRPSSHPTLPASARMATDTNAHTHRHAHTHSHRHLNQISGLFPLQRFQQAGSLVSLSHVSVSGWGRLPFFRLQFSVQLETSLPTHPHGGAGGRGPLGNGCVGVGARLGNPPFCLPSGSLTVEPLEPTPSRGMLDPTDTSPSAVWGRTAPHFPPTTRRPGFLGPGPFPPQCPPISALHIPSGEQGSWRACFPSQPCPVWCPVPLEEPQPSSPVSHLPLP